MSVSSECFNLSFVFTIGLSLVQRNPTEYGVSKYDSEPLHGGDLNMVGLCSHGGRETYSLQSINFVKYDINT